MDREKMKINRVKNNREITKVRGGGVLWWSMHSSPLKGLWPMETHIKAGTFPKGLESWMNP